ncbi:MAG: hypothetical protein MK180_13210 [Rhodobacteraceae bacterium]|nr:hypothetical protein [Paracoccaceae bacterium]
MAARADGYTRAVNTLKVLLPIGALGLLSTLFLFSGEIDPSQSIPYAELNVEQLAREQRVTAPYFSGVTEDGVAVTLTGDAVVPGIEDSSQLAITELIANIQTPSALLVTARAPAAALDTSLGTVLLTGGAKVQSSEGLRIVTDALKVDVNEGTMQTLGPIEAEGPFGNLNADVMQMTRSAPDAPHRIAFEGNVKLVYREQTE